VLIQSYATDKITAKDLSFNAHLFNASNSESLEKGELRKTAPPAKGFKSCQRRYRHLLLSLRCYLPFPEIVNLLRDVADERQGPA
jgi:hypothetical protein